MSDHSGSRGFTLMEVMLSVTLIGIIAMLAFPDFIPFLERQRFVNTAFEVWGMLEEAQWLAMTQAASHRVRFDEVTHEMLLDRKRSGSYEELQRRPFPEEVGFSATRWPSFSPFGFALLDSILLNSPAFRTTLVVSSLGRIRQTEVLQK